jgi:trans-2,3-dihydro-3-hydroxyanthranilate isomerase
MRYRFHTADVFTDRIFGGNPLAVLPDAGGLDGAHMQRIAAEFNLSETVFVLPPEDPANTRRLRIFTPAAELPFAGHPTVGTAHMLAAIGEIPLAGAETAIVFEEGVGPVPVTIRAADGKPTFAELTAAQLPEVRTEAPAPDEIAAMLSLEASDLLSGADAPEAISCGVPLLFVPLRDRQAVGRARLDQGRWERLLAKAWAPHVYVFSYDTETPGADIHARMFAPALGVAEDPATGGAAAPLAGYLGVRDARRDGTLSWRIEQGLEMGRPSFLEVEADKRKGDIIAIRVGGSAVLVSEGTLEVPGAQAESASSTP